MSRGARPARRNWLFQQECDEVHLFGLVTAWVVAGSMHGVHHDKRVAVL